VLPKPHNRAFAEMPLNVGERSIERLLFVHLVPLDDPQLRRVHGTTLWYELPISNPKSMYSICSALSTKRLTVDLNGDNYGVSRFVPGVAHHKPAASLRAAIRLGIPDHACCLQHPISSFTLAAS
jgi:hypothetical protein